MGPVKRSFSFRRERNLKNFPSIKKHADFVRVSKEGRSFVSGPLILLAADNHTENNRLGITISHRQGNSVVRHAFARKMREIFRYYNNQTVRGKDIVVIARNGAGSVSFECLSKNYRRLLSRHKLLLEDVEGKADTAAFASDLLN